MDDMSTPPSKPKNQMLHSMSRCPVEPESGHRTAPWCSGFSRSSDQPRTDSRQPSPMTIHITRFPSPVDVPTASHARPTSHVKPRPTHARPTCRVPRAACRVPLPAVGFGSLVAFCGAFGDQAAQQNVVHREAQRSAHDPEGFDRSQRRRVRTRTGPGLSVPTRSTLK